MSQATNWGLPTVGPKTPGAYSTQGNASFDALLTGHLGTTRPTYLTQGMWFKDTGVSPLLVEQYYYDGADDILVGTIDYASNTYTPTLTNVAKTNTANTFTKTQTFTKGSDVASASTLNLGDGNYFDVTGTTTISAITSKGTGTVIRLHFNGTLTLTHNASSFILPTGANITTSGGDEAVFIEYSTNLWRCVNYSRASGAPLVAANAAKLTNVNVFTASGTWNKPSGFSHALVFVTAGGGGGGGNSGGSGAAGGTGIKLLTDGDLGSSVSVTVGSGGTGSSSSGGSGGASSFGAHITTTGGGGGNGSGAGEAVNGGLGGSSSGGDINLAGGDGDPSTTHNTSGGGASYWGGGGRGVVGSNVGRTGQAYGSGGGGGGGSSAAGGDGAPGVCIVYEYTT